MITVYSRKGCQHCELAKEWLKKHNIPFDIIDLENNEAIVKKLVDAGFYQLPIITDGKKAISGYSEIELSKFIQ